MSETSLKYGKNRERQYFERLEQLGYGKGFGLLQYVVFSFAVSTMLPIDTFSLLNCNTQVVWQEVFFVVGKINFLKKLNSVTRNSDFISIYKKWVLNGKVNKAFFKSFFFFLAVFDDFSKRCTSKALRSYENMPET